MISVVVIFCITTMVASAPSDVRPVINPVAPDGHQVQASDEPIKVTSVNFPSQITDDRMKSKRMFDVGPTGFQPNYLPVSPSALTAFYSRVGLPNVLRHLPASYFPAYYPANYPDNYGFRENSEIKSDAEDLQDALGEELRLAFGAFTTTTTTTTTPKPSSSSSSSTSGNTKPSTPTNPMAPIFNTLIALNNMQMLKLFLANTAMLFMG
ncbi:hypothetical protein DAPPUDRAFT_305701 [Daphnia pulex]|uniref:Uncharacterized protein n=1 Tax=Daphnia pulex TaxID=6669 RepID=E9FXI2_DAPPU|nr:hypothetical protein DAPPUDRAFT_305701 [Daphnia pulex]|eukprot:EFX88263.1 hypothetical protein DAPPUDRAFT_305701 [Daphnia pulex]